VACAGAIRVRQLGGDRAGEVRITRFLRNRRVTVGEMFGTAAAHTAGLVAGRHVLAIQDPTSLRGDGAGHSLNLQAMTALDATKLALLGLLHGRMLAHRDGRFFELYQGTPVAVFGPDAENIHGIDESVGIASMHAITRSIALTAAEWCGTEPA
jgi:acetylornithine deacetylase/succinyl-diaminopimelate desuccinylase-like protein